MLSSHDEDEGPVVVEQAIGVLMQQHGLDAGPAREVLRKYCGNHLVEVAERIVERAASGARSHRE